MRVAVLMPAEPLEPPDRDRALAAVRNRFGPDCVERLVDPGAGDPLPSDPSWFEGCQVVVFVESLCRQSLLADWRAAAAAAGMRVYSVHMATRLRLEEPRCYDAQEYPAVDAHVFNRLSRRTNGYVYQPYGPVLSDVELGRVNAFGFRVADDYLALAGRPLNHKVVAVFGGSSAFSYYCFDDETFSARLQDRLNRRFASRGLCFSVLNFGMHDNVVMQEMINYLVHAAPVRPDVVIAHDGHNDMYYGLQGDPLLVNDHAILYQRLHQEWAKLVQGSEAVESPDLYSVDAGVLRMNLPDNVIDAYVQRKRQFQRVVQADGGHFLWGVQPLHASKGRLSRREVLRDESANKDTSPYRRRFMQSLNHVYDLLSRRLEAEGDIAVVDFHQRFHAFGEEHEFFWDYCHLSPAGDEAVAESYETAVAALFDAGTAS